MSLKSRFMIEIQVVVDYVSRKNPSTEHLVVRGVGEREVGEVEVIVRGIQKRSLRRCCKASATHHRKFSIGHLHDGFTLYKQKTCSVGS